MRKLVKRIIVKFMNIGKKINFGSRTDISISSKFGGHNYIGDNSTFNGEIGYGSYIGYSSKISGKIGKYSCISSNVHVVNGWHPTSKFVSLHPAFYGVKNCTNLLYQKEKIFEPYKFAEGNYDIIVGNDVWIGANVVVLAGVRIADGAIIGAGSVVTKDVKPYSIVAGVPATEIRKRFNDNQINKLLEICWWKRDETWIMNNYIKMFNIDDFIDKEYKTND